MNSRVLDPTPTRTWDDEIAHNTQMFFEADRLEAQAYQIIESYSGDAATWALFTRPRKPQIRTVLRLIENGCASSVRWENNPPQAPVGLQPIRLGNCPGLDFSVACTACGRVLQNVSPERSSM